MTHLYLLRHGIAVPYGSPDLADDDRPLTPEGERRIRQVGRALARLDLDLERIATSPLPRACRTAELVAEAVDLSNRVEVVETLRSGREAPAVADWLKTRSESRLMLVGHNPTLSDLVAHLVVGPDAPPICDLHKGGIAALRSDGIGRFQVDWIARPKLFRS